MQAALNEYEIKRECAKQHRGTAKETKLNRICKLFLCSYILEQRHNRMEKAAHYCNFEDSRRAFVVFNNLNSNSKLQKRLSGLLCAKIASQTKQSNLPNLSSDVVKMQTGTHKNDF